MRSFPQKSYPFERPASLFRLLSSIEPNELYLDISANGDGTAQDSK